MVVLWAALVVAGLATSVAASGRALGAAEALGHRARLSPYIIGLTIVSIGTDLPEIANSILASATGRGDINVGDSTGSAATQITLVLGVVCLVQPIRVNRRVVASAGFLTVGGFLVGAAMMADGSLSRLDGAILVLGWLGAMAIVALTTDDVPTVSQPPRSGPGVPLLVGQALLLLGVVAIGAAVAVSAFGRATEELGVPEYATSFIVLSIGTSLPELIVDTRAVRQGSGALAVGDILGSSLIDATLSLGIGPLLFPTMVSPDAARGTLLVGGVVLAAVLLLLRRTEHGWRTGVAALALYLVLFPIVIS